MPLRTMQSWPLGPAELSGHEVLLFKIPRNSAPRLDRPVEAVLDFITANVGHGTGRQDRLPSNIPPGNEVHVAVRVEGQHHEIVGHLVPVQLVPPEDLLTPCVKGDVAFKLHLLASLEDLVPSDQFQTAESGVQQGVGQPRGKLLVLMFRQDPSKVVGFLILSQRSQPGGHGPKCLTCFVRCVQYAWILAVA